MIPTPSVWHDGGYMATLGNDCVIACDQASREVGALLRGWLAPPTGWDLELVDAASAEEVSAIRLITDEAPASGAGDGGYSLRCDRSGVTVVGKGAAGTFYGVQSLRLLLPPETLRSAPMGNVPLAELRLPAGQIDDHPRFRWRGVHLDVARHFFPKQWLLRLIELISLHKLNVLHLHLTDDQGWRLPVDRYPRLVEVGAWRAESMAGHRSEGRFDGVPHGGYYTKADLHEIVSYAARHFVTVVPEIDMPGHMQAAIAAYPELGNLAEPVPVRASWGISNHILNMERSTLDFCRHVIDEVVEIFPSRYVHLGGDECPTLEWETSPSAQQRMSELGFSDERELQGWFVGEMAAHLKDHNRILVGWDEMVDAGAPAGSVIMSWRGEAPGYLAASLGHQVVMTPEYWTYLDWAYAPDPAEPLAIRAATSVRRVHSFEPAPHFLGEDARRNILGAQCQLWSEYVADTAHAEYQYFPRLCAFADVTWSAHPGTYQDFEARLRPHLAKLDALGVNYRPLGGPTPGQARTWRAQP